MGQTMGAMGDKRTFESQPQGFSGSEWGARFLGKGAQGLSQGMKAYQQENSALQSRPGFTPQFGGSGDSQAPQFSTGNLPGGGAPAMMGGMPQGVPQGMPPRRNTNMFYGG